MFSWNRMMNYMEITPPNLYHLRNWKKVKMFLVSYLEILHFSFIYSFSFIHSLHTVLRIRIKKKKQPNPMTTIIRNNQPSRLERRANGTTLGKFCFCKMNQRDGSRQAWWLTDKSWVMFDVQYPTRSILYAYIQFNPLGSSLKLYVSALDDWRVTN